MTRAVYVNGRYQAYLDAKVHAEDRGFQFADSVYEVIEIRAGRLVDLTRHMARLQRSLGELAIRSPMSDAALRNVMRETIRRNRVASGSLYIQVSRGAGPRDFALPDANAPPTLVVIARASNPAAAELKAETGIAVKSMPDIRWRRSDIKSVMLLPACLAKDAALIDGAREAWFVDDNGLVTEGASSNAWIVGGDGRLVTRQIDDRILAGVTRATALDAAALSEFAVDIRAFTLEEAYGAREAFITAATNIVMPVVAIDGRKIGDGRPGPVTRRLRSSFHHIAEICAL